jgi:hypothetical protein
VTKAELRAFLKGGHLRFPPLEVREVQTESTAVEDPVTHEDIVTHLDALLTLAWQNRTYRFGVEARRLWTPKIVSEAVDTARRHISFGKEGMLGEEAGEPLYPLVLVPYLSDDQLQKLEAEGVSGIDMCGNGIVVVPGEVLVLRTGFPNRFRWESAIKNVYRKNSSIVARVFLLVPHFNSVSAVLTQIQERGGEVSLATVSKVCKSLEDDLIIERCPPTPAPDGPVSHLPTALRLLQADKLLDLLTGNYAPPAVRRTFQGKSELFPSDLRKCLAAWEEKSGARVILTGASSTERYAVMPREPVWSFYCSDIDGAVRSLGDDIRETDRFANVRLLETQDAFVYFDRRPDLVSSPIQTYLELMAGDKRERETADQVRRVILGGLAQAGGKG